MLHRGWEVSGVRQSRNGHSSGFYLTGQLQGAGVPISRNLHRVSGELTNPTFLFSSKETWMVAGTIRSSCRQIKPAWDRAIVSPPGECSPPTPAGGLEGGTKGRRRAPRGCPRSGRGEVGSSTPATSLPPRGPASGRGIRSPPRRSCPRQTPQLRSEGGIGTSPVDRAKRLWVERDALRALVPAGLAGGSLPGERALLSVPPQTSARRRGRRGSHGGLTRRSWLISS